MTTNLSTTLRKNEAEDHLRDIRRRKGVDHPNAEHDDNVRDLNRALGILSDQLYQKETHFILELIQNADDNTFENDVVPTLSFHLVGTNIAWQMRVGCNETGFQKKNIEALCRIGDSTKSVKDRIKGYIGEKGIGFKSVFKVANIIHISSNAYSFRFDRQATLGMITPIIETFPPANLIAGLKSDTQGNQTQLLLELLGESEFKHITHDLQTLKPEILIFLRKIRRLIIQTQNHDVQFEIRRTPKDNDFNKEETVTIVRTSLHDNETTETKYLVVRRIERNLFKDERRENVDETEIVLAFPVDKGRPLVHAQDTYAYLPINDYGFRYLIQADFLLTAGRESVISTGWDDEVLEGVGSLGWNEKVLEGVFRTFIWQAVPRFNRSYLSDSHDHNLRYTWPLFLKDGGGKDPFWSKLKLWIFNRLKKEAVLESRQQGKLVPPKSLFYIPPEYRLNGNPLVEDETSRHRHLSFFYDIEIANTLPQLKEMGVEELKFPEFFKELKDIINKLGDSFLSAQTKEWHSQIAYLFPRHSNPRQVAHIPLIPLRDGRWVTPSQSHLFLEGEATNAEVPNGLDICIVDHKAYQDKRRMKFFSWVGIKRCNQAEVYQIIIESYKPFRARTLANSVQDLIYLFQTPQLVYNGPIENLQVLGARKHSSGFMYARRLYIKHPGTESIVSKYSGNPASSMPTLNPAYIDAARALGKETEFVSWVCSQLNMSLLPRLVDERGLPSPEFNFLKTHAIEDLLLLLRDNWDHYAGHFPSKGPPSRLKRAISEMSVPCMSGISQRLELTVLPRDRLKLFGPHLTFIDVPDPNDTRWLKFSAFGVLTNRSTEFYLRELKALVAQPEADNTSKSTVEKIYQELGLCKDPETVRKAFAGSRLVFLQNPKRWVFLSECVWDGPPQLKSTPILSSEYPLCSSLFRDHLVLGNAALDHVVKELQNIDEKASFDTLQQLLLLLNKYLTPKSPPGCLEKLKGKKIIPVTESGNEYRMDYDSDIWYFADKPSLWDRFKGKVPLISFDVKTVRKLSPLINAMELSQYLLSAAVTQTLKREGLKIEDRERTSDLRGKAQYLIRLLPEVTAGSKSELLSRLLNLQVWGVQAIKLTQEVNGVEVIEDTNDILFDDDDYTKLEIYFSIQDSQNPIIDFELSKKLIQYCEITDHNLQTLVLPIIQYPHKDIEKLLEDYGLDESDDDGGRSTEPPKSISGENDNESDPVLQTSVGTISLSRTPSPDIDVLDQDKDLPASKPSFLRDRIPELDQSIAAVREAAILPSTTPAWIITPSRSRTNASLSIHSTSGDTHGIQNSIGGNDLLAPGNFKDERTQSAPSTIERGTENILNALDFADFNSEFSKVFEIDTPTQNRQKESTQHHSVLRYSRRPQTTRMQPDPESTIQGIQRHKIGFLGETFIDAWLSDHLKDSWDSTRYWTSRNRNVLHPESPFKEKEGDYTDFTYPDTKGDLTRLLNKFFPRDVELRASSQPTYHLEVKSTSESCDEPLVMSNSQLNKARGWTIAWDNDVDPKDIYVILRVYNLEKKTIPDFAVYVDPWALYMARKLEFWASETYLVKPTKLGVQSGLI